MLDLFLSLPLEEITVFLLKLFLTVTLFASILFAYKHPSIIFTLLVPIKHDVDIVDTSTTYSNEKMAVTKEDVLWYLDQVKKKNTTFLDGITRIYFKDRPLGVPSNVLGSYFPFESEGRTIHLYPTKYDEKNKMFYLEHYEKDLRIGYSPSEMKENILSTLGHEIGHNVAYNKTKKLKGEDIEKFCSDFSKKLYIVEDKIEKGRKYTVSKSN